MFAGSVALTGGLVGVSVSGAGASSENRIATFVQAYIQDDEDKTSVAGASIGLNASDSSKINSFTGAVSVAASGGLVGVSLSIGVGVASNQIDSHVASFIKDIDAGNGVTTDTGDISIKASETATIHATAVAASAAVALGGVGASLSGAGGVASNVILGCANAYIENSILAKRTDVILDAENSSTIEAVVLALSDAVGGGEFGGLGLSIGAAIARNYIGYSLDGDSLPIEVQAYIITSSVHADRDLKLSTQLPPRTLTP